jgi:hypothetical protein
LPFNWWDFAIDDAIAYNYYNSMMNTFTLLINNEKEKDGTRPLQWPLQGMAETIVAMVDQDSIEF